jgi:hypothetical protein
MQDSAPTTADHWSWSAVEVAGVLSGCLGGCGAPARRSPCRPLDCRRIAAGFSGAVLLTRHAMLPKG